MVQIRNPYTHTCSERSLSAGMAECCACQWAEEFESFEGFVHALVRNVRKPVRRVEVTEVTGEPVLELG
jgi:hypothetical protein